MKMREEDIRPARLLDEFFRLLALDAERLARKAAAFVAVPCAFCGSDAADLAFTKQGYDYRLCRTCGSLYVSPRPTEADLIEYADTSEAVRFWSTNFYRETAAGRREKIFRPRARLVADLVRSERSGPPTIADIGSGYGLFLQELAAAIPEARLVGIEPDRRLAGICREQGFRVVERWIEEVPEAEIAADLATCFEVIEHAFDPLRFLAGCARALRPGGLLLLTTLTIGGFDLLALWDSSRSITPPQHINFPSLEGARRSVLRAGLEVVRIETPGELDVDIVRNVLLADPNAGVPRVARAIALADDAARSDFQAFLKAHGLSSHLRVLARRPA